MKIPYRNWKVTFQPNLCTKNDTEKGFQFIETPFLCPKIILFNDNQLVTT